MSYETQPRRRPWVHFVAPIVFITVVIVSAVFAISNYNYYMGPGDNAAVAGYAFIFVGIGTFIAGALIGAILVTLTYLLFLPPRSTGGRIVLIIGTCAAGLLAIIAVIGTLTLFAR